MIKSDPPQCIYCKRTNVQLNREHVIPEAFGSYGVETMVLSNNAVCKDCNSRLGGEIDQILNRDSYEALIRANSVARGQGNGERFSPRRFSIFIPDEERFGILRGARMTIDWNTKRPKLLDQIIVRDRNCISHTFLAEEFPQADSVVFQDLARGAIRIVGMDAMNVERLMQMVRDRGFHLGQQEVLSPPDAILQPDIFTLIKGRIDTKTWRAIAKIAFNYLTFHEGARFVLSDRFDPIRDFITGVRTDRAMVRLLNAPILAQETKYWRAFEGHLVAYQTEGRSLRGKISLYNSITYDVMLCADLGLYYRLNNGHAFDPIEHLITRLRNLPFHVPQSAKATHLLFTFS